MSTHNICFCGEIRKIFTGYPPLSRPMHSMKIFMVVTAKESISSMSSLEASRS